MVSVGIVLALCAAFFATCYALLSRTWVKYTESPLAFSIFYTFFAFIFSAGIAFIEPWKFTDATPFFVALLILSALFYGLYDATQFSARKYLEASNFALLLQIVPIVVFFLSVVVLKEPFTIESVVAVILIVLGNCIALYKNSEITFQRGALFGVAAALFTGCAYTIDKVAFSHFPIPLYSMTVYLVPSILVSTIFFVRGGTLAELKLEFRRSTWRTPVLSLVGLCGYYSLLKAYQLIDASIAVPLMYTSTALTVVGGIVLLRERKNIPQKILGVLLVCIGVILLQ